MGGQIKLHLFYAYTIEITLKLFMKLDMFSHYVISMYIHIWPGLNSPIVSAILYCTDVSL